MIIRKRTAKESATRPSLNNRGTCTLKEYPIIP